MASLEDELKDLKEKNNELVQKVQHWKVLAGQRENDKINLMQEMNELRLQLSMLRNDSNAQARNLEAALQLASQKALDHLVHASTEIARTMDLTKAFREELATHVPRIGSLGGTPASAKKERVHRVPPLMIGGQSIQPVVALTMLDTSNPRFAGRSPSRNRDVTERAVPMHVMLQDVHIPLTRIDVERYAQSLMDTEENNDADDSSVHSQRDDNENVVIEESQRMSGDEFDSSRVLNAVEEGSEPDSDDEVILPRRKDNPLEGPSWMLDATQHNEGAASKSLCNLEPDSTTTTELEGLRPPPPLARDQGVSGGLLVPERRVSREFSPTVRRRKRAVSPPAGGTPRRTDHYSPRPSPARRLSNSGRVLKVLVAKMRLDEDTPPAPAEGSSAEGSPAEGSPPKRLATVSALGFDAPSPNGATVPGLIVSEASQDEVERACSGEPARSPARRKHRTHRTNSHRSNTSHDSHCMDLDLDRPTTRTGRDHSRDRDDRSINTSRRTNSRERSRERQTDSEREHAHTVSERQHSVSERQRTVSERQHSVSERQHTVSERQPSVSERQPSVSERQRHISTERSKRGGSAERANVSTRERGESRASGDTEGHQDTRGVSGDGRSVSRATYDSDSGSGGEPEGRSRRQRQRVTYKEKPLNRKMRR